MQLPCIKINILNTSYMVHLQKNAISSVTTVTVGHYSGYHIKSNHNLVITNIFFPFMSIFLFRFK